MKLADLKQSSLKFVWLLGFTGALLLCVCGKKTPDPTAGKVLVKVADKEIRVDEFIRRAEYTIRPPYCRQDNYIHKKIILNSLIAEKLLALEAGEDNELTANEQFQDYIRGRKEQAMRQWLFHEIAYKQVKPDTSEIKKINKLAGRKYKVNFITLPDSNRAGQFKQEMADSAATLEALFQQYFGAESAVPVREVGWEEDPGGIIHEALFSAPLKKEQVVGPLKTDDGHYLLLQIAGWTDRLAITEADIQRRWKDVSEKIKNQRAGAIYHEFVGEVMRGKRVEFARPTFNKLVEIFGPIYLKSMEDKQAAFNQRFWENDVAIDSLGNNIDEILEHPLLQIDGETWNVQQFLKEMRIHPLVFRKQRFGKNEFPEQFKLAMVDLIRDKYVTREAYERGYDSVGAVTGNAKMWQDYLLAMYQKNQYLKSVNASETDFMKLIDAHLNQYVDSLQTKYFHQIEIDTDAFEQIQVTGIDLFALQKNVPFPIVVPGFPLLTTDNKLDYGKKMSR